MRVEKWCRFDSPWFGVQMDAQNLIVCVLAGGRSSRMGREKSNLLLGGETFLQMIQKSVRAWNPFVAIEVITEDLVEKCGPIGGILTAFSKFRSEWFLFLSCDMPFVSPPLLTHLTTSFQNLPSGSQTGSRLSLARFAVSGEGAGFPFVLHSSTRNTVEALHQNHRYSLQNLARELNASLLSAQQASIPETDLMNINTPEDFVAAQAIFEKNNRR